MDYLNPTTGRTTMGRRARALSINSITEHQQNAMNTSLDNLQNDLSLINSQWNRTLTEKTNPLELALAFLDDTSVGLGHRYQEFNQLKSQIGAHLQDVVNEHSQVFNANVASYGKTVACITEAQENTSHLKRNLNLVNENITMQKGSLMELNESNMKFSRTISVLSSVEELLQLPEKVEDHIRNEEYKDVQKSLERGFQLLNNEELKNLKPLKPIRQQLELQEHVLFNNLIEELHNIIYSKKNTPDMDNDLLKTISITQNGFTSLENYLYNIANIDIMKHSHDINSKLDIFVQNIGNPTTASIRTMLPANLEESEYYRIFHLLSLLHDINRLPTALSILINRSKEEIHNIILKSTEKVRKKNPTLIKMTMDIPIDNNLGLTVRDLSSMIMRECFWEIFIKLLFAMQAHRAIFESLKVIQTSSVGSSSSPSTNAAYRIDKVWNKLLDEILRLLSRYLNNPALSVTNNNIPTNNKRNRSGSRSAAPALPKRENPQIFNLQDNIDDGSAARNHAGELKALLKDIFPGFAVSSNMDLESIYIKDESFEQEESLLPPSVFNMKVILEPFLLFSEASFFKIITRSIIQKYNIINEIFYRLYG